MIKFLQPLRASYAHFISGLFFIIPILQANATDPFAWFTENKGQIADQYGRKRDDVKFIYYSDNFKLLLREDGFSYELFVTDDPTSLSESTLTSDMEDEDDFVGDQDRHIMNSRVDVAFDGCNKKALIQAKERAPFYQNFYNEHTGPNGVTRVRSFQKITYSNIYPGIDAVFSIDNSRKPEYSFVLHPGCDPTKINLVYSLAGKTFLNNDGGLCMVTVNGCVTEAKPFGFYENTSQLQIPVNFSLHKNRVSFVVPEYDKSRTFVIDPAISWATYYGGKKLDMPDEMAISSANDVFITGRTESNKMIATEGSYQTTFGGNDDAFLVKFDSDGNLLWATYYGGKKTELGYSMCKDDDDNIYLCGRTNSVSGIASEGAFQTVFAGGDHDCYIAKFNSDGIRLWSTYYGGTGLDRALSCTTDKNKVLYLTGYTESIDGIATPGAYKTTAAAKGDAFITKFTPDGVLVFGTYYGGPGQDRGHGIAVDDWGNIITIGTTTSKSEISITGAMQKKYAGGIDIYLNKFTNDGQPVWATYYGGTNDDRGRACVTDAAGNIIILAQVESIDIKTTPETFKPVLIQQTDNDEDALIAKFDSSGEQLWATYFGGNSKEQPKSLKTDRYGSVIYISGSTKSTSGLSTPDAFQKYLGGLNDAFVARINYNATILMYASYYGGKKSESDFNHTWYGAPMEIDHDGNILLASGTMSADSIAYGNAYQTTVYSDTVFDFFIAKFIEDCFDSFENNDEVGKAPKLFFDGNISIRTVRGTVQSSGDADYFMFPVGEPTVNIRCSTLGLAATHTITIYDENQTPLTSADGTADSNAILILNGIAPGNYYVGLSTSSSSPLSSSLCYNLSIETASVPFRVTGQIMLSDQLNIFPNPSDGEVTIVLPYRLDGNSLLRIMNLTGKVMSEQLLDAHETTFKINIESLPAGQYVLAVSNKLQVWDEKLMKN